MSDKREKITFRRKKVIFHQGDAADCMYRVDYGMVEIYINYKEPNEKLLARLDEDSFFGEMALLDNDVRSATAVAATDDTRLEVYPVTDLAEMLTGEAPAFRKLLSQMSKNLTNLTDRYLDVCRTIAAYQAASESGASVPEAIRADIEKYAKLYKED